MIHANPHKSALPISRTSRYTTAYRTLTDRTVRYRTNRLVSQVAFKFQAKATYLIPLTFATAPNNLILSRKST